MWSPCNSRTFCIKLVMQAAYYINLKEQYSSKNDKQMVTIQIHSNLPFKIYSSLLLLLLVHGQVTIIFVVSVCLFVCLSVCLCTVFLSRL